MKVILTYRIFTEEPGNYIVVCENYPLITTHCNSITRCVDAAKNKTDVVLGICKDDIIRNYRAWKMKMDGWHFQLLYNLEEASCEKVLSGKDLSSY